MPARAPDFRPGALLPGTKYRVVRELGAGGMGIVYQVVKPPEIQGVLKLMSADLAAHAEFRTKFFDEVRVLARLDHPNIVKVSDYDSLEDGTPYYVMELLTGRTVRDVLATTSKVEPRVAYEITRQLCEALHCAHTHDPMVVHRDIKPENIFLHAPKHGEPVVKLIDFGVVAIGDRDHDGSFVGTWRYAAPEQIRGERATPATDIYAVGLVLYELLTGAGPFDHLDTGKLVSQAHLHEVPAPISKLAPWVPAKIVELVAASLAKDPKHRPRTAIAFAERLFELQWANDGKDPHDATKEGPLSRALSVAGGRPSSKNLAAAKPASDRLGDVPLIGVPPTSLHQGNTLKGVGERHVPTTPDDDALLDGLLARRGGGDDQVSRKARERADQVVIRPSGPDVVGIQTPRNLAAVTMDAPASRPHQQPARSIDTDTFASQESDAGKLPRARVGRFAIPIALAALGMAAAGTFMIVRHRGATDANIATAAPPPTPPPSESASPPPPPPATTSADVTPPPPSSTAKHPPPVKSGVRTSSKPESTHPAAQQPPPAPTPTPKSTSSAGMIPTLGIP
jgi:serine/threonine protein kinase